MTHHPPCDPALDGELLCAKRVALGYGGVATRLRPPGNHREWAGLAG